MKFIVIDPGHGGPDPGAVGPLTGLKECDVAYEVSRTIVEMWNRQHTNVKAFPSHAGLGASLRERCDYANGIGAMAFISIHANAAESKAAHGFEVFTSPGETGADFIASSIFTHIHRAFPELRARTDYDDGDPDKEANFFVLRNTQMPAVLVELAFITNFSEEILLGDPRWQAKYAATIMGAIAVAV